MKFTYDTKQNERECVAYISETDELFMKNNQTGNVVCFGPYGSEVYVSCVSRFDPSEATHKFYPGDKVTIEF